MSAAGDAASLFGSADATGDPFAAVLGNTDDTGVTDARIGEQPTAASDFFENGSASEVFGQEEHLNGNLTNNYASQNTWYDSTGQSAYSHTAYAGTNHYSQQYQANEWYQDYNNQPSTTNTYHSPAGEQNSTYCVLQSQA